MSGDVRPFPQRAGEAEERPERTHRIFIRDLVLQCLIGVYRHERDGRQRVRINLDLTVASPDEPIADRLSNVVSYESLIHEIRALAESGHMNLLETFAERIADISLADPRVRRALIRVEKLDVFADAASAGVEIERFNEKA